MRSERGLEWTAVGLAYAAVALVIAGWLAIDRRPPEWDHANHLERAVLCARDLARGDLQSVVLRSTFYPPLVPCLAGLAFRLLGSDVAAGQGVEVAFLGLGMAATYLLARRGGNGLGGVVAALVFGTSPIVVWQALRFQLDLPLAALVAVALEVLARTESFGRRGWSIAAGAVFGLGLLAKPPFAVYLLPALALALAGSRRAAAPHAALAAVVAGLFALPWYGPRLLGLGHQISVRSFRQAAEAGQPEPLTAAGLLYYPRHFAVQLGALGVLLFCAGLVVAIRRRRGLLLAGLSPFVVFLLIQNKNLRYTLPLLPAAAAVAGLGASALPRRAGLAAAALVAVAGGVQVGAATFDTPPASRLALFGVPLVIASPPLADDWRHHDILAAVARDSRGAPATVSVVPNHPFFSVSNFRYYAVRDGLGLQFVRAWADEPVGIDYMVTKTGDLGPAFTADKPRRVAERLAADTALARVYPVIGQWRLPDGSVAALRARRVPPDLDVAPERLAREIEAAFLARLPEIATDVEGLAVRLHHDRGILAGRLQRVEVAATAATVGELRRRDAARLRVRDLRLVLDDVLVNPFSAHGEGRLQPLDVGRVRLERARVSADDFRAFVTGLKPFRTATVRLEDQGIRVTLRQPGPDVEARVRLVPADDRPFALVADEVRVGGLPVPRPLVDWVIRTYDPSLRLAARLPVAVEIAPVTISPAGITLAPGGR